VWSDTNGDGLQDAGEITTGVQGVTVNLLDDLDVQVATTQTDLDGAYSFTVDPNVPYHLEFIAPSGLAFSPANVGSDDTIDSDADTVTGQTTEITLAPGATDDAWDAGLVQAIACDANPTDPSELV